MAFFYFDTSALVKYYVTEPGSDWVRAVIDERIAETQRPLHHIFVAEITRVEIAAGLAAIERANRIRKSERDREYRRFISHLVHFYTIMSLTTADFELAATLTQSYPLKAYDSIQLAVALHHSQTLASYNLTLTFVSGDNTQLAAAQAEGLPTDNPFAHISS